MEKQIIKKIQNCKVVSFDMFDTLVLRNVCEPIDIFRAVEKRINELQINFVSYTKKRIEAEKEAIKNKEVHKEEITIDDIYKCLVPNDIELREKIKIIEKEEELKFCTRNEEFDFVIEYCRKNNIMILVLSDMYLDKNTIESMLEKCGIYYDKLYLSSELQKRKSTGNMYKYVVKVNVLEKSEIIHIGDNFKSDFIRPRLLGIRSIYYKHKEYRKKNSLSDSIIEACSVNELFRTSSNYYKEGYRIFGPLLLGFCQWIDEQLRLKQFDQVLFLSRDGYIIQKAYELVYKKSDNSYVLFSRRSVTVPQLYQAKNFQDVVEIVAYIKREETMHTFLHKIGIEDKEFEQELVDRYGEIIYRDKLINDEYQGFFDYIKLPMYENSYKEKEACKEYISSVINGQNIAIVDIGWYGTMQHNIIKLIEDLKLNINISGLYLGYLGNKYKDINARGFIFDVDRKICNSDLLFGFNGLIETFFSANHGSVKKYVNDGGKVIAVLEEWEKQNWRYISEIHQGALKFLKDYTTLSFKNDKIKDDIAWEKMGELLINPNKEQLKIYGNLQFYDAYYEPLIKYQGIRKYLKNPLSFKEDLMNSNWKLGFIKSICGGILNSKRCYLILNKIK